MKLATYHVMDIERKSIEIDMNKVTFLHIKIHGIQWNKYTAKLSGTNQKCTNGVLKIVFFCPEKKNSFNILKFSVALPNSSNKINWKKGTESTQKLQ